ncbi:hypothetical protein [Rathayibacter sp. AY1E1]|uniref:hypothetical protein n=1 Tax=Rathayibacter sp. AY1E1 TaxID=2080549 RepID=UPI0011B0866A|nr:hypothetical protein [Rathayibacter sp. AY1E1]
MDEWSHPYSQFQHKVRTRLKERLRRNNGRVMPEQFEACVRPGGATKAAKMRLRLFTAQVDGALEWKPDLVSEDSLRRQVSASAAIDLGLLIDLWARSRRIENRAAFPNLAPAGNKSQHVSMDDWRQSAVFGVDILIRPLVEFSGQGTVNGLRNDLVLSDESFAVVAHGNLRDGQLVNDGEFFARLVIGKGMNIPRITSLIPSTAQRCELAMFGPLLLGDADGVVDAVLQPLSRFATEAYRAFLS